MRVVNRIIKARIINTISRNPNVILNLYLQYEAFSDSLVVSVLSGIISNKSLILLILSFL